MALPDVERTDAQFMRSGEPAALLWRLRHLAPEVDLGICEVRNEYPR